jgi:hypothetical protein
MLQAKKAPTIRRTPTKLQTKWKHPSLALQRKSLQKARSSAKTPSRPKMTLPLHARHDRSSSKRKRKCSKLKRKEQSLENQGLEASLQLR